MEYDHKLILSSDDILNLTILPKSIVVIGSGAIGVEFSRILSSFDVNVTLVEVAENLLPLADIEISKRLERVFKAKNLKFYTKKKGVMKFTPNFLLLSSTNCIDVTLMLQTEFFLFEKLDILDIIRQ